MTIAEGLLLSDDGAAWDRVRVVLERKGALTGAEVEALVFTDPGPRMLYQVDLASAGESAGARLPRPCGL